MKFYLLDKSYISSYLDEIAEIKSNALLDLTRKPESKPYEISNGEALIPVSGPLQRKSDFFSFIFGSSSYDEITEMTIAAEQDPDVEKIAYIINSPGGEVDGVDTLGQTINETTKPTISYIDNMATSAAYWIASQTDKIVATSPTAEFGSIGVIVAGWDCGGILEKEGAKRILISSTDAPEKKNSYQLDTKEGEDAMIKRLDAIHEVFADRVAIGRKTNIENVNQNFGRGGVVSAKEALTKGMIDNILSIQQKNKLSEDENDAKIHTEIKERKINMDKKELSENHPELLNEIEKGAFDEGKALGIQTERKRVEDLNVWREKGDACAAIVDEAIKDGSQYLDVASKLHANQISNPAETDPPGLNGGAATRIDGEDGKITEEKATTIGKEIAKEIGGV